MAKKLILIILVIVIIGGGGYWFYLKSIADQSESNSVAVLDDQLNNNDQKENDDEFLGWSLYIDEKTGTQFSYPAEFGTKVWHPKFWPPRLTVVSTDLDPVRNGCPNFPADATKDTIVLNGTTYDRYKESNGGVGSLYDNYCYVTVKGDEFYVLYFLIWSHLGCGNGQCGAICGAPEEAECRSLDRIAAYEKPIEKMVGSLKF